MNNLLERLHASFFFYILTSVTTFVNFGGYLASAILVSVSMIFGGLRLWVVAGWQRTMMVRVIPDEKDNKETEPRSKWPTAIPMTVWRKRDRPVIQVLAIMLVTHVIGYLVFLLITAPFFFRKVSFRWSRLSLSMLICFLGTDTRTLRAFHSACLPPPPCSSPLHPAVPHSMPGPIVPPEEVCTTSPITSHLKGVQSIHIEHRYLHYLGAELQSRSRVSRASRCATHSHRNNRSSIAVLIGLGCESDGALGYCIARSWRAGGDPGAYENCMGVASARCMVPSVRLCSISTPYPPRTARLYDA